MKENNKNNCFYCYSYKLMKFLNLLNERYLYAYHCSNGNTCWVYKNTIELNDKLTQWNKVKKIIK